MSYRNDLEAAQNRIADLERQVEELKAPSPLKPESTPPKKSGAGSRALLGFPVVIALLAGSCVVFQPICGRACGAITDSTAPCARFARVRKRRKRSAMTSAGERSAARTAKDRVAVTR